MILITSPLMKDKIVNEAEAIEEIKVNHIKTEGINMYFETDTDDETALPIVKKAIKNNPNFKGLMISVKIQ